MLTVTTTTSTPFPWKKSVSPIYPKLAGTCTIGFGLFDPAIRFSTMVCLFVCDSKTASLGEMIQQLTPLGIDVPGGFAVSSTAYDAVLDQSGLRERLREMMEGLDGTCLERKCCVCVSVSHMHRSFVFPFQFKIWTIWPFGDAKLDK